MAKYKQEHVTLHEKYLAERNYVKTNYVKVKGGNYFCKHFY